MCKILLSINPEHVENIINKSKKYEYRKTKCKKEIDKTIIYSTLPVGKVIGEVEVIEVVEDSPEKIWDLTVFFLEFLKNFLKNITNIKIWQLRIS